MKSLRTWYAHVFVALLALVPLNVASAVPMMIGHQGVLTDSLGTPLTEPIGLTFQIYDESAGGAQHWSEYQIVDPDDFGRFGVLLGSTIPIADSVFRSSNRWLSVTPDGFPELQPRIQFVGVAYSFRVASIDSARGGTILGALDVLLDEVGSTTRVRDPGGNVADYGATKAAFYSFNTVKAEIGNEGFFVYGESAADKLVAFDLVDSSAAFGVGNSAQGTTSFVSGMNNTALGTASVIFGSDNSSDGWYSTIGGGRYNRAEGHATTISGGDSNYAVHNSFVGGGNRNHAGGGSSVLGGGEWNRTTGQYAVIGGGRNNWSEGHASVVAGGDSNYANHNAFIGGGNRNTASGNSVVAGGEWNRASGLHSAVGGGRGNWSDGEAATVAGGDSNYAVGSASVCGGILNRSEGGRSFVGGGERNLAAANWTTIAGGRSNVAVGEGTTIAGGAENENASISGYGTIGGGRQNTMDGHAGVISGGERNAVSAPYSIVAGGADNNVSGGYGYAAGRRAKSAHNGSFVWADTNDFDFVSAADNSVSFRCSGGARFVTGVDGVGTPTSGVELAGGGGSWSSLCDSAMKENIRLVDPADVLSHVAILPISTWNYKSQADSLRHIGPMAQDFFEAFGLGESDRHITTIDADGVALAAIQALARQNQLLADEIAILKERLTKVESSEKSTSISAGGRQ